MGSAIRPVERVFGSVGSPTTGAARSGPRKENLKKLMWGGGEFGRARKTVCSRLFRRRLIAYMMEIENDGRAPSPLYLHRLLLWASAAVVTPAAVSLYGRRGTAPKTKYETQSIDVILYRGAAPSAGRTRFCVHGVAMTTMFWWVFFLWFDEITCVHVRYRHSLWKVSMKLVKVRFY